MAVSQLVKMMINGCNIVESLSYFAHLGRAAESALCVFSRDLGLKVTLRAQTIDQIMFMVILT